MGDKNAGCFLVSGGLLLKNDPHTRLAKAKFAMSAFDPKRTFRRPATERTPDTGGWTGGSRQITWAEEW